MDVYDSSSKLIAAVESLKIPKTPLSRVPPLPLFRFRFALTIFRLNDNNVHTRSCSPRTDRRRARTTYPLQRFNSARSLKANKFMFPVPRDPRRVTCEIGRVHWLLSVLDRTKLNPRPKRFNRLVETNGMHCARNSRVGGEKACDTSTVFLFSVHYF